MVNYKLNWFTEVEKDNMAKFMGNHCNSLEKMETGMFRINGYPEILLEFISVVWYRTMT